MRRLDVGKEHLAGVSALDGRHPGGDRHPVRVRPDLFQPFAAGDRADQYPRVVQRRVDLVHRRVQRRLTADLHGAPPTARMEISASG